MKKKILGLIGLLLVTPACGLSTPVTPDQIGVSTIVAETLQTTTANTPTSTAQSGISVSYQNISFIIPEGVATSAQSEIVPRSEENPDMGNYWATYPEYSRFLFTPSNTFTSNFETTLSIMPVQEYAQMNEHAQERIAELQKKLAERTYEKIRVLPPFNAALTVDAQITKVEFHNGSGIRAIQEYHQAPNPITNDYLIYTFQGITNDGRYYISLIAPISVPFLIDESYNPYPDSAIPTPSIPEGGFEYPLYASYESEEYTQYIQAINNLLSQTPADHFTPSITLLDSLVQSIDIR